MKFIKIISMLYIAIFLNGCVQSAALLGPGITVVTTGNVLHAGFQYGANSAIKNETGKDTLTHLKDAVDEEKDSQNIKTIVKNTIDKISKKLTTN